MSNLKTDIRKLIENECATYGGFGNCLLDCVCPFFRDDVELPRCIYFENSVLPADEELKARYWNAFGYSEWGDGPGVKLCESCRRQFQPRSNRQKYCKSCGEEVRRRQRNKQSRRYRENHGLKKGC